MSGLPNGWVKATINEVVQNRVEQHGPSGVKQFIYIDISSVDRVTKRIVTPQTLPADKAPSRARQNVHTGDVLVSMTRPNLNAVAVVPPDLDQAIASTGFEVLRPEAVSPRWLYYLVQTNDFIDAMTSLTQGALYPAVRPKDIRNYQIEVPPLSEQQRIVEQLDALLTDLDAGMTALKRAQANLKKYLASLLKAACEGRLVPTEAELARGKRPSFETGEDLLKRILVDRRTKWEAGQLAKMIAAGKPPKNEEWKKRYKEPEPPETTNLPNLPDGWTWASVDQIAAEKDYSLAIGPFGSSLKVSDYRSSGVPLVFVRNVRSRDFDSAVRYVSSEKADELRPHIVRTGDLLITKMGDPPGDVAIYPQGRVEGIITADVIKITPHEFLKSVAYLSIVLQGPLSQAQVLDRTKGVAQKKVSLARFKSLAVPLAPIADQLRIAESVELKLSIIERADQQFRETLARSVRLRESILKRAFEGKLEPQDPKDEPASVLLERIRQSRLTKPKKVRMSPKRTSKEPESQKNIADTLRSGKRGMTPEQLLNAAGFTAETIDDFYAELKQAVLDGHVREIRHGHAVTLEAKQL